MSIGVVISELARRSFSPTHEAGIRNGIRLFPVRAGSALATPELIKALLEESE